MSNLGEIVIYQSDNGLTRIEVKMQDDTVWLTQKQIEQLYGVKQSTISEHINNILVSGELDETSIGFSDKSTGGRKAKLYNLDMIISIGYRVNTKVGIHFRKWATERLKEYMIKGFTMDDERLKGNENVGWKSSDLWHYEIVEIIVIDNVKI